MSFYEISTIYMYNVRECMGYSFLQNTKPVPIQTMSMWVQDSFCDKETKRTIDINYGYSRLFSYVDVRMKQLGDAVHTNVYAVI